MTGENKLEVITEKSLDADGIRLVENINRRFIEERFKMMEQGVIQAEKSLMTIKEKLFVESRKANMMRRTTLDCTLSMNHEPVKVDYSNSTGNIDKSKNYDMLSIFVKDKFIHCAREQSIDYPYIMRRTPNMLDVVRKRLLFQKIQKKVSFIVTYI